MIKTKDSIKSEIRMLTETIQTDPTQGKLTLKQLIAAHNQYQLAKAGKASPPKQEPVLPPKSNNIIHLTKSLAQHICDAALMLRNGNPWG